MKRVGIVFALLVVLLGFSAPAQAATNFNNAPSGAHYANGASEPVCTVSGATVTCTATEIAGVGNTNATVSLVVNSTFSGTCHNPGTNRKIVEPFSETETVNNSTTIPSTKNGRLVVPRQSTVGVSQEDFEAAFSCPNPNWDADFTGSTFSFTYSLTFAGFNAPAILITG